MKEGKSKYDQRHLLNLAAYTSYIDRIYYDAIMNMADIGARINNVPEGRIFSFEEYPRAQMAVNLLMHNLQRQMQVAIVNGINTEWSLSNNKNNALARRVFGRNVGKLTQAQYRRYFSTNDEARKAFLERKERGLNLSERVWKYAELFKSEIELSLDVEIRNGRSAQAMARNLRNYLQHPDELYRRVRDEHGNLQLSKRAAEFHPGQGVYRSSYKNARRLAATETNMAYRTADQERWSQFDFVVGIEVHLSNNHTCIGSDGKPHKFHDICDRLAGRYPKGFDYKGWHPHCRCYATPILKTQSEIAVDTTLILNGAQPNRWSVNMVHEPPEAFKEWVIENRNKIATTERPPYFVRDNMAYIDSIVEIANR